MHEHGGPALTDFGFHNLGIGFDGRRFRDNGRFEITRRPRDAGYFRTPSLRDVAITGPYMHDGSLETLRDVVDFYDGGGIPNPNQSRILRPLGSIEEEKRALVAFLKSMTSQELEPRYRSSAVEPPPEEPEE